MKVSVFQPVLPHYRIPFFNRLAAIPEVDLTVYHGASKRGIYTSEGADFRAVLSPLVPSRVFGDRLFFQPAMHECDLADVDVAVFNWNARFTNLKQSIRRASNAGVRTILWGHGRSQNKNRLRAGIRNRIGKRADGVLLYDHQTAFGLVERESFNPNRVFVAPNALDDREIRSAESHWRSGNRLSGFLEQMQVKENEYAIFVSRLLPENRGDFLLEGLRLMRKKCPEFRLVIVGDGPDQDRLKKLVSEFGLENAVIFTGPLFDERELAPWMLGAAFCAYPLNIGLSLLHAFHYGVPVITHVDPFRHGPEICLMEHGVTGLQFQEMTIDSMVSQWLRIISCEETRLEMSRQARRRVNETHSIQGMVDGFHVALASTLCVRKPLWRAA